MQTKSILRVGDDFERRFVEQFMLTFEVAIQDVLIKAKEGFTEAVGFLKEESIKRCPIDTATLENDHQTLVEEDGDYLRGYVFFGNTTNPKTGLTPFEYAIYAHELIEPEGPRQLGERSALKAGSSDAMVGGGFLRRALADNKDDVIDMVAKSIKKKLRK